MSLFARLTDTELNQAYWDAKAEIRRTSRQGTGEPSTESLELLIETQMEARRRPGFRFKIHLWNPGPARERLRSQ